MARLTDIPLAVPTAGQTYDYTNPPPFASFWLVNAPLDPDHRNAGMNKAAYDAFIAAEVTAGRAEAYTVNVRQAVRDVRVPLPFEQASQYNYGRLTIDGYDWYVFYDAVYLNKSTTIMRATLDFWPSFQWSLGYSTIRRGHVGVAVSQGDTYGDQYLTTPEPFDAPPVDGVLSAQVLASAPSDWTVLVISTNDLRGNGTATPYFAHHFNEHEIGGASDLAEAATVGPTSTPPGAPQMTVGAANYPWLGAPGGAGVMQVFVPDVTPSPMSTIDGVAAGGGAYLFTIAGYQAWLAVLQGASWIMDGIVDIRLVPGWALSGGGTAAPSANLPPTNPLSGLWATAAAIPVFQQYVTTTTTNVSVLSGWRSTLLSTLGAGAYRKILTAPYVDVLVGNGESVSHYRPDQMRTGDVQLAAVTGATHGEPTIRVQPTYNELGAQMGLTVATGGREGRASSGFSRAASNTATADMGPWQTAFTISTGRQVLIDQQALAVALAITGNQMTAGVQGFQTAVSAGASAISGGANGGAAGLANGTASAVGQVANYAASVASMNNSIDLLDRAQDGALDIATYQFGLSALGSRMAFDGWAQSLLSASGSGISSVLGSAWRAITDRAFEVIISVPSTERINQLLSMWRRYGYMIGRAFTPSTLAVMTHFSYWQTEGATVVGAVPQEHRQNLAASFDRGVTVWASIGEIGTDVSGANAPVTGSYY